MKKLLVFLYFLLSFTSITWINIQNAKSEEKNRLLNSNLQLISQNFNFSAYTPTELDELLNNPPDVQGMRVFKNYKIAIKAKLEQYPKLCNTNNLHLAMRNVWGISEPIPVSSCIKVKTAKGRSVNLFIQDTPARYIKQEAKLEREISLYAIYVYYGKFDVVDRDEEREQFGILVGAYQAE